MPRPTTATAARPRWRHVIVDAPGAYYSAANINIEDDMLEVWSKRNVLLDTFPLDRDPSIDETDGKLVSIVAVTGGAPLVVRPDGSCHCNGTRKVAK